MTPRFDTHMPDPVELTKLRAAPVKLYRRGILTFNCLLESRGAMVRARTHRNMAAGYSDVSSEGEARATVNCYE